MDWLCSMIGKKILWVTGLFAIASFTLMAEDVEFPAIQSFGSFSLTDPVGLEKTGWQWRFVFNHANINLTNEDELSTVNMEWTSLTLSGRYGLSDRLTLEGALRLDWSSNGILDRVIEGFHSSLGLPDGGRDLSPRNLLQYTYKEVFRFDGQGAGPFISPHLAVLWTPFRTAIWSVSLRSGLTIHPKSRLGYRVSGILPFLGAAVRAQFSRSALSLTAHWRPIRKPNWLEQENLDAKSLILISVDAAYKIWRLGLSFKNSPYPDGRIGQSARQIYLGCRLNSWLEIGLYEELFYYTTLADVGFRLGIYW